MKVEIRRQPAFNLFRGPYNSPTMHREAASKVHWNLVLLHDAGCDACMISAD